jgi:hypothetical protein
MSNSTLVLREGRLLARGLAKQLGKEASDSDLVVAAFEQVLTRRPNVQEQEAAIGFLAVQRKLFQSAQPAELSAGAKDNKVPAATDPNQRALENLIQALFSHHDFITIR